MIEIEQIGEVKRFRLGRTVWGRGWYFTGAYWVDGLVVDTGCAYTVRELESALQGSTVDRIVNTHSHEDHVAGNAVLQAKFRADVLAHPEAVPFLADPRSRRLRPYQLVMWGYPAPSKASAIASVLETRHLSFQVIHTPGHSPDHVCLYEPERGWLFTGDAYVGGRDRALRLDYNIWQIIDSLKKLASLGPKILFTGSGTVRLEAAEELATKIAYLEETGARVLDLHAAGWNRRRIREKLLGPEMPIAYFTLGNFSGRNLVRSFIEDRARPLGTK
jgi:glyoxylase-like metal-dependent hydrolase (beta-lactamase superfamily II)